MARTLSVTTGTAACPGTIVCNVPEVSPAVAVLTFFANAVAATSPTVGAVDGAGVKGHWTFCVLLFD